MSFVFQLLADNYYQISGNKKELCIKDLSNLVEALSDVKHRWYEIGLQLQVHVSELTAIEDQKRSVEKSLIEMLKVWLTKVKGSHTWAAIVDVLKRKSIG